MLWDRGGELLLQVPISLATARLANYDLQPLVDYCAGFVKSHHPGCVR